MFSPRVELVALDATTVLPTSLTMRLWEVLDDAAAMEFFADTVGTGQDPTAVAGVMMAAFQFANTPQITLPGLRSSMALTVHRDGNDVPSALLRSGPFDRLPANASLLNPSILFAPPFSLTFDQLAAQVTAVFADGPLQFQQLVESFGPVSVTLFVEVDSAAVTSLNPSDQTISLTSAGRFKMGRTAPEIAYTATARAAVSGSRDVILPKDVIALTIDPQSLSFDFNSGSTLGAVEAEAAQAFVNFFVSQIAGEVSGVISNNLNVTVRSSAVAAIRQAPLTSTLTDIPDGVVLSIDQVTIEANQIAVTAALGAMGDVLELLLEAATPPPPPPPAFMVTCHPQLARREEVAKRQFTVAAMVGSQPVAGTVYYPTRSTVLGDTNTTLDVIINGQWTATAARGGGIVESVTYPAAFVVPDASTGYPTVRCELFEP
jgi:hypothetical protein